MSDRCNLLIVGVCSAAGGLLVGLVIAAVAEAQVRTWTDATGKFTVEAELVKAERGVVALLKNDGTTQDVPMDTLCERDRLMARLPAELYKAAVAAEDRVAAIRSSARVQCERLEKNLASAEKGSIRRGGRDLSIREGRRPDGSPFYTFPNRGVKEAFIGGIRLELMRAGGRQHSGFVPTPPDWDARWSEMRQKWETACYLKRLTGSQDRPTVDPFALEVGQFGTLSRAVKIQQIAGEADMLVMGVKRGHYGNDFGDVFWLKGYPTRNLVDDKLIAIEVPVHVSGTKRYGTALGGSNTVYVVEPIE